MRDAENAAFARGISAEALMDQAGSGIAQAVQRFFPRPGYCLIFSGKGNNGGDALVAAARLKRAGWHTDVHLSFPEPQCSDLLRKKITDFRDTPPVAAGVSAANTSGIPAATVILDGLLGVGSKPPLRDPILAACREINRLRQEQGAYVFAVDQPTGLDGDSGGNDRDCVIADFTVTIAATKRGLVADNATNFVGRLDVVPLSDLSLETADETVACTASLHGLLPRRPFDAHALNAVSTNVSLLKNCCGPRLLTPHPGEMKRLAGDQKILRGELARKFTAEFPVTLLLKGSRTVVAESGKRISYNTTGNPGMATGGMGDVLTGVCAALLAQNLSPFDAARIGAWACGRAAELALFNNSDSEQSLLPRDVLTNLGHAFREL